MTATGRQNGFHITFHLPLILLSVAGAAAVLFATTWGSTVPPDTVVYVDSARHLLSGHGLTVTAAGGGASPMTHFPPLFPMVLAALGLLGLDPLDGARWLNAVLMGANVLLVGLAIRRFTHSAGIALFGALLTLTSIDLNSVHAAAISEPLFILEAVVGLLLLDGYLEGRERIWLLLSAVVVAAAVLTRYAGGALLITGVGVLLLGLRPDSRRRQARFKDTIVFLAIACFPILLWMVRNRWVADTLTNRAAVFHPISGNQLYVGLNTFARWFVTLPLPPGFVRPIASVAGVFLVGLVVWVAVRQPGSRQDNPAAPAEGRFPLVFAVFLAAYVGFLLLSLSFFDAGTPLDGRILSPLFVGGLVVVLWLLHRLAPVMEGRRYVHAGVVVIALLFMLSYAGADTVWLLNTHRVGRGYSSQDWQQSQLIAKVRQLPANTPIYSNAADAIFILTGRVVNGIPAKYDATTQVTHENYQASMSAAKRDLQTRAGVAVYFRTVKWRPYQPSEDELKKAWNLKTILAAPDGTVYGTE